MIGERPGRDERASVCRVRVAAIKSLKWAHYSAASRLDNPWQIGVTFADRVGLRNLPDRRRVSP